MGIRAKARQSVQPVVDPWVDTLYFACEVRCESLDGRARDYPADPALTFKDGCFKRKGRRTLRIPLSLLEEHINEFLNLSVWSIACGRVPRCSERTSTSSSTGRSV